MITPEKLRKRMERGEFFMEYQPIVCLQDRSCMGAEALVRWRRDQHLIPPSKFVPRFENTPLSGLLTYWVIEHQARMLAAMGLQLGQGHLYSASLPASDFMKFWDDSSRISGRHGVGAPVSHQAALYRCDD